VAVDELLSADPGVRQGVYQLIQQLNRSGDVALYLMGRRNERLVNYTSDLAPFVTAINGFPTRPQYAGSLVESLFEIGKSMRTIEGRRAIVAVAPEFAQPGNVTAEGVLSELQNTGTVLYAATLVGLSTSLGSLTEAPATRLEGGDLTAGIERDRLINDGPKQSGGLRISSVHQEGLQPALTRIGNDLLNQYAVTYILPAGSKSDGRISLTMKRKGLTLRGPSRVPQV
jgi:hypothetical protein